jgi:hypothetical protein
VPVHCRARLAKRAVAEAQRLWLRCQITGQHRSQQAARGNEPLAMDRKAKLVSPLTLVRRKQILQVLYSRGVQIKRGPPDMDLISRQEKTFRR